MNIFGVWLKNRFYNNMSLGPFLCNKVIFTRCYRCEYLWEVQIKSVETSLSLIDSRVGLTLFVTIVMVCTWINNSTAIPSQIVKELAINVNYAQLTHRSPKTHKQYILLFDGLRFVNFFGFHLDTFLCIWAWCFHFSLI